MWVRIFQTKRAESFLLIFTGLYVFVETHGDFGGLFYNWTRSLGLFESAWVCFVCRCHVCSSQDFFLFTKVDIPLRHGLQACPFLNLEPLCWRIILVLDLTFFDRLKLSCVHTCRRARSKLDNTRLGRRLVTPVIEEGEGPSARVAWAHAIAAIQALALLSMVEKLCQWLHHVDKLGLLVTDFLQLVYFS